MPKINDKHLLENKLIDLRSLYDQRKFSALLKIAVPLSKKFPDSKELYTLCAVSCIENGKFRHAIEYLSNIVDQFPTDPQILFHLGYAHKNEGDLKQALGYYYRAISIRPNYFEAIFNAANILVTLKSYKDAIKLFEKAHKEKPNSIETMYALGHALNLDKQFERAEIFISSLLNLRSSHASAHNLMGNILANRMKYKRALAHFKKAAELDEKNTNFIHDVAYLYETTDRFKDAIAYRQKLLELNPNNSEAANDIGKLHLQLNNQSTAREYFERAIANQPDFAVAHQHLSMIIKYTENEPHFKQLLDIKQKLNNSSEGYYRINFALGKAYDDIGDFGSAFKHFRCANMVKRSLSNYKMENEHWLFTKLINTSEQFKKLDVQTNPATEGPIPIFIFGMPRSGTTLVEQILSTNPAVTPFGELPELSLLSKQFFQDPKNISEENILKLRADYLKYVARKGSINKFFTDKMPHNFRFVPIIRLAFPEAKLIHVVRNPCATCWSNFKHYFEGRGLGYSDNLKDTVEYYGLYANLLSLWKKNYRNHIIEVDYDDLTRSPYKVIRKLVDDLNLEWQDSYLTPQKNTRIVKTSSMSQVRKPIYSGSSEDWRNYEEYIKDYFEAFLN